MRKVLVKKSSHSFVNLIEPILQVLSRENEMFQLQTLKKLPKHLICLFMNFSNQTYSSKYGHSEIRKLHFI